MKYYTILFIFSVCLTTSPMQPKFIQFAPATIIQITLENYHQFYVLSQQTEISAVLGNSIFTPHTAKIRIMGCLADSNNTLTQSQLNNLAEQIMTILPTAKLIFGRQDLEKVAISSNIYEQPSDREKWRLVLVPKL